MIRCHPGRSKPVVLAVGKVCGDEGILELGVLTMVEPIHTREALSREQELFNM